MKGGGRKTAGSVVKLLVPPAKRTGPSLKAAYTPMFREWLTVGRAGDASGAPRALPDALMGAINCKACPPPLGLPGSPPGRL